MRFSHDMDLIAKEKEYGINLVWFDIEWDKYEYTTPLRSIVTIDPEYVGIRK